MTELILVRHGETDWNRELRFQGQVDVPLNAIGHEQARRLAQRLATQPVHQLVSSDLSRAVQTAQPLAELHPALQIPTLNDALREQNFGVADGLRAEELRAQHPQALAQWLTFGADFAFDGGESTRQFHARVLAALQALAQQNPQQTLVVVTHGGVLDMVFRTARGLPLSGPRQSDIPNAGLNRVRLGATGLGILDWADTAHLADMPAQPVYDQTRRPAVAAASQGGRAWP